MGDVLLSFLWNTKLIPYNPALGLSSIGLVSAIGITVGLVLVPSISKFRNQAYYLGVGSALRAAAVLALALAAPLGDVYLVPFAALVQVVDMIVAVLTAGAVNAILAEHFPKERFVQVTGFNQVVGRVAVLSGWLLGGLLVAIFSTVGLIWVDFVSFIPITVLLFIWARHSRGVAMVKPSQQPSQQLTRAEFMAMRAIVVPYAIVYVLGSLVSRTTPLLWRRLFPESGWSYEISQGVLFATFVAGYLAAGVTLASKKGAQRFELLLSREHGLIGVTLLFGLAIGVLPLAGLHPLFMGLLLFVSGLFSGFVPAAFLARARLSLEGISLRRAFYLLGLVGRFGEPAGGAIAGGLLIWLSVSGLYAVSGLGIVALGLLLSAASSFRSGVSIPGQSDG